MVDRAAEGLMKNGVLVRFDLLSQKVEPTVGGKDAHVRIELLLGEVDPDDPDQPSTDHEWGGLGFMYCIGVLSFGGAVARGISGMHFVEGDSFSVADFLEHVRFERGNLELTTDYVRGRCMKTRVRLSPDGKVLIETVNRMEEALDWVAVFKGKHTLEIVEA